MTISRNIFRAALASAVALGAFAGLALTPGEAAAEATKMRVSHQLPPRHHIAKIIAAWGEEIEKRSNGSIDVEVFGSNQAYGAKQNFPAVARGEIEAAFSVNFQWGKTVPEMNVTLQPFGVTDMKLLRNWAGSAPAKQLGGLLAAKGVKNVTWLFTTNSSAITSKGGPLIKPADFKGVKIRGINKLFDATLIALGAAPSAMSGSKVYQALQTGVIDAGLTDIAAAYSRKYYEVQDYVSVLPLFSVFFHGYVNPKWWDGLSDAQRDAITKASASAGQAALDATESAGGKAPGQLAEKGMKVHVLTPAEIEALRAVMQPAFDKSFAEATSGKGAALLATIKGQ
ncbi:MAG: TRAP transporter substrate-binding protein DctP [Alphaproteobacteria bacterium]